MMRLFIMESLIIVYNTKVIGMIGAIGINSGVIMLFLFFCCKSQRGCTPAELLLATLHLPAMMQSEGVLLSLPIIAKHLANQVSFCPL